MAKKNFKMQEKTKLLKIVITKLKQLKKVKRQTMIQKKFMKISWKTYKKAWLRLTLTHLCTNFVLVYQPL